MITSARRLFALFILLIAAVAGSVAARDITSPVGTWKTIDDTTGRQRSIVRIYEQDGELFARVEQVFPQNADEPTTCIRCKDDRKDRPIVGLVIMRHMKPIDGEYRNGDILDPENGSVYRCRMRLEDGGRSLRVRGYIGISLFGRSQVWERQS